MRDCIVLVLLRLLVLLRNGRVGREARGCGRRQIKLARKIISNLNRTGIYLFLNGLTDEKARDRRLFFGFLKNNSSGGLKFFPDATLIKASEGNPSAGSARILLRPVALRTGSFNQGRKHHVCRH